MTSTAFPKRRSSKRRRRSSIYKGKQAPKLFDYFVVVGVKQTDFNAPTDKEFPPNSKDIGWEPHVQYSYNSNKIVSASTTVSTSLTTSGSSSPIPKLQERYSKLHVDKESEKEELQLMEQIRKFSFCDLSDLVNRFNKLSQKDKEARKYYKVLGFKHGLQSEKFTFCVTKSNGTRLYGTCRRLFTPDVNLKPTEMPTALVLISSHPFHDLFDQIMDHIVARWFICHQAIFPILDALLLNPPPALGDTFRVSIKSQVSRDDEVLTFKLNSTYHVSLKKLFQTLSVDNILWLVSCILTERRMIFYCNSLETLSECIHGLLALIYPFRWQHIFVPVLPESLINYLAAPMPFIIGIKSYLAHSKTEFEISEVILVDLDKQSVRSTDELQSKLKSLPPDPSWKLKRELKKLLKKYQLPLQTHDEYRIKYGNYNHKSLNIPKFNTNMDDAAKGWDDLAFYDAFLAFFVLFIGDWKNFYDASNKNVPKPPYHLSSEYENRDNNENKEHSGSLKQSTTEASHTPPLEDSYNEEYERSNTNGQTTDAISGGNDQGANKSKFKIKDIRKLAGKVKKVGGIAAEKIQKKIKDEAKRREVTKDKKMYYNSEALEYIELLCQSQLFQTWFVRQQKEANDSVRRISGVQDRYDYVMQNFNRIGASYTGCYKYLCQDSKYRNANHHIHGNLKQVIELCSSFTSNRDYTALMQQQQSIQLTLKKLADEATRPLPYNAIKNIILYRLNECYGKNNHPHGLMALYLLANLIENSSDRILIECINNFVFYANVLTKYQHEKMLIAKQMNKIALEVVKLSTRLEELKKKKIDKYVAFGDDYEYKYDESKHKAGSDGNNNGSGSKSAFIDDKIAQIDFANIANNKQDQSLLGNFLHSANNNAVSALFTEVSQFKASTAGEYRARCARGEVRMIPPFEHLRQEFGAQMPDDLLVSDDTDILAFFSEDEMDDDEFKKNQDIFGGGSSSKRPSERASDFAMNILNSFSPKATNSDNNGATNNNEEPKLNSQQLSIFDLGHKVDGTKIVSSGSGLYQSDMDNDGDDASEPDDYDASGGFLSRTDTRRDQTGNTIRGFNKDWVNFDDNDANENDNDQFNDEAFDNFEDHSRLDDIFASSGDLVPQKKKVSARIKGGLGSLAKKAKTAASRQIKRRLSNDAFGLDAVNPIRQSMKPPHKSSQQSKDFDALNFGGGGANKGQNKADTNGGYSKLKKTMSKPNVKSRHNNVHKADANNSKAASLFSDFDFSESTTNEQTQTPQQTFQPSQKAQDTFGDLFGDFSSNSPKNVNNMGFGDFGNPSSLNEKKSVQEIMQGAYNNKSYNNKKTTVNVNTNNATTKNKNLFDDLFD